MQKTLDIEIPVMWQVWKDRKPLIVGCYVDVSVPIESAAGAPVVADWEANIYEKQEFRAFAGRLMEEGEHRGVPLTRHDLLPAGGGIWRDVEAFSEDWHRRARFPFPANAKQFSGGLPTYVDDPSEFPELVKAAERAKKEIEACVIMDGVVWVPSSGPLLSIGIDSKNPRKNASISIQPPGSARPNADARNRLSAFDIDVVTQVLEEDFKVRLEGGGDIRVHSDAGWSRSDTASLGDEALMRDVVFALGAYANVVPPAHLSTEMIEALIDFREVEGNVEDYMGRLAACRRLCDAFRTINLDGLYTASVVFEIKAMNAVLAAMESRRVEPAPELVGFSA